jgi:hypothetical protein
MGKEKKHHRRQGSANERWPNSGWTEEAFPTDESSVGSKKKSKRKEVNSAQQVFSQPWAARGERSGLQTRIAVTVQRFVVRADEKLTAFWNWKGG